MEIELRKAQASDVHVAQCCLVHGEIHMRLGVASYVKLLEKGVFLNTTFVPFVSIQSGEICCLKYNDEVKLIDAKLIYQ